MRPGGVSYLFYLILKLYPFSKWFTGQKYGAFEKTGHILLLFVYQTAENEIMGLLLGLF